MVKDGLELGSLWWSKTQTFKAFKVFSLNAKNWSVFPNPTDDKLFINYNDKTKFEGKLILYDLLGSKLLENKLVFKGNTLYDFDVSFLINGIYFLVIIDKDRQLIKSEKVIINNSTK